MGKLEHLPTQDCEAGYGPDFGLSHYVTRNIGMLENVIF